MNKLSKTAERIHELYSIKCNELAKIEAEEAALKRELSDAEELKNITSNTAEYDDALKRIASCKGRLTVLTRKAKTLQSIMTEEEYQDVKSELNIELERYSNAEAVKIDEQLRKLVFMMNEYAATSKNITDLMETAERLSGRVPKDNTLETGRELFLLNDPEKWFRDFVNFYFAKRSRLHLLAKTNGL